MIRSFFLILPITVMAACAVPQATAQSSDVSFVVDRAPEYSLDYENIFDPYFYDVGIGRELVDVERMKASGESVEAVKIAEIYNQMVASDAAGKSSDEGDQIRSTMLDRWNWCGPSNTGGAVINSADNVCRTHDICLSTAAKDRQKMIGCDNQFIAGMKNIRGQYAGHDREYIEAAIVFICGARACRPWC